VHRCRPSVRRHLNFCGDENLPIHSVNIENSMHLDGGFSAARDRAIDLIRTERNFRIAIALQNFLVHLAVAHRASAFAAACVDHDFTGHLAGSRIELKRSTFEPKCSVHCMQHIAQSELYRCLGGIDLEAGLLREGGKNAEGTRRDGDCEKAKA